MPTAQSPSLRGSVLLFRGKRAVKNTSIKVHVEALYLRPAQVASCENEPTGLEHARVTPQALEKQGALQTQRISSWEIKAKLDGKFRTKNRLGVAR